MGSYNEGNTAELWTSANPFERSIQESIEYVVNSAHEQIGFLPGGASFLPGKTVCEIGPGQNFGIPLVMMSYGAKGVIIDRFLCDWDNAYHPRFYSELRNRLGEFPGTNTSVLDAIIESNSHNIKGLDLYKLGLEECVEIPDLSIDVTTSNACFEHLFDIEKALRQLGRITRSGGVGFHQTDFRDHRDFSVPLEYLTMPDPEFAALLEEKNCSCGNRMRFTDFLPVFEAFGFAVEFRGNNFADPKYLDDILSRAQPRFLEMPREAFRVLSGRFHIVKR